LWQILHLRTKDQDVLLRNRNDYVRNLDDENIQKSSWRLSTACLFGSAMYLTLLACLFEDDEISCEIK
jgi:hypothetical protein